MELLQWICRTAFLVVNLVLMLQAQQTVRRPPDITTGPTGQTIFKLGGLPIEIPCLATGTPQPTEYQWYKNGALLNMNTQNIRQDIDPTIGTITIIEPTSMDEGYYQCTAKNQWGRARSDVMQVIMASLASYPTTNTRPLTALENTDLRLNCDQTKVVPNATFSWAVSPDLVSNVQQPVTMDARMQMDDHGNLYFGYLMQSDSRSGWIYKCLVKNAYLDQTIGGSYVTLSVTPNNVATVKPIIRFSTPATTIGIKGRDIGLRCISAGKESPKYLWQKVNGQLPVSRVDSLQFDTLLKIKNLQVDDEGSYQCTATNSAGSASTIIHLDIRVIPEFLQVADGPHDVNVTDGDTIVINCTTNAEPTAKVAWIINGEAFTPTNRRKLSPDGLSLTLSNLCRDCSDGSSDLMVVSCNASNEHGYAYVSGYVNIMEKTVMTEDPQDTTMQWPYDINITCAGKADPSTPLVIEWFDQNGDRLYNDSTHVITQDSDGKSTLRLIIKNDPDKGKSRVGTYIAVVDNGLSKVQKSAYVSQQADQEVLPVIQTAFVDWWVILVLIAAMLLIFIIILICCVCVKHFRGDVYKVDESEVKNGNNPKQELLDNGYKGYVRKDNTDGPTRNSRASLDDGMSINSETGSLAEYEADYGKFNEEGSFIGAYNSNQRSTPGHATNV